MSTNDPNVTPNNKRKLTPFMVVQNAAGKISLVPVETEINKKQKLNPDSTKSSQAVPASPKQVFVSQFNSPASNSSATNQAVHVPKAILVQTAKTSDHLTESLSDPSSTILQTPDKQVNIQTSSNQLVTQQNKFSPIIIKSPDSCSGLEVFERVKPFLFQEPNPIKTAVPQTKDSLLLIYTANEEDREEIKQRLENKQGFIVQEPNKKLPKILVLGVLIKDRQLTEVGDRLAIDNYWSKGEFRVISLTKSRNTRKGKTSNIVIEISKRIRSRLDELGGKLIFEGNGYKIKDIFSIKQCSSCHRLGHTSQQCRSAPNCRLCGEKLHKDCQAKIVKDKQYCVSCKLNGHFSTSQDCPKLVEKINLAKQNVDFEYTKIY